MDIDYVKYELTEFSIYEDYINLNKRKTFKEMTKDSK